jgi:hypothetical protein
MGQKSTRRVLVIALAVAAALLLLLLISGDDETTSVVKRDAPNKDADAILALNVRSEQNAKATRRALEPGAEIVARETSSSHDASHAAPVDAPPSPLSGSDASTPMLFASAHRGCEQMPPFFASLQASDFAGRVVLVAPMRRHAEACVNVVAAWQNHSRFVAAAASKPRFDIAVHHFAFAMRAETHSVFAGALDFLMMPTTAALRRVEGQIGVVFPYEVLWCRDPFQDTPSPSKVYGIREPGSERLMPWLVVGHATPMRLFLAGVVRHCSQTGPIGDIRSCFDAGLRHGSLTSTHLEPVDGYYSAADSFREGCGKVLPLPLRCERAPQIRVLASVGYSCAEGTGQATFPEDVCSSMYSDSFVAMPSTSAAAGGPFVASMKAAVKKDNPALTDAWNAWKPDKAPPPPAATGAAAGTKKNAVLSVAVNYGPDQIDFFMRTFLKYTDPATTTLVLFVNGHDVPRFQSKVAEWSGAAGHVEYVDVPGLRGSMQDYIGDRCGPGDARAEMLAHWLHQPASGSGVEGLRNVDRWVHLMIIDSRDAVFQCDPFAALQGNALLQTALAAEQATRASSTAPVGFVLDVVESYQLGSPDFYKPIIHGINADWTQRVCGRACGNLICGTTFAYTELEAEPFPVVNSGHMIGSSVAMLDMLTLMKVSMRARLQTLGECPPDQGMMHVLFGGGFAIAAFPHLTGALTPERSQFMNAPRTRTQLRFNAEGKLVNCYGQVYAVVHQLDREMPAYNHLRSRLL